MSRDFPEKGADSSGYIEAARIRSADREAADARTREASPPTGGAAVRLVQTTTVTTYPTVAARFYAVTPLNAGGTQTEGATGSTTTTAGTFYALNLGSGIPPNGTKLLVTYVDYRWVFRYDS